MLKRVGSIVLTIAMLLTLLCNVAVASAEGEKPQLAVSVLGEAATDEPIEVERGKDITLLVSLENYVPAMSIEVKGSCNIDAPLTVKAISGTDGEGNDYVVGDDGFFFHNNPDEGSAIWTSPNDVAFPDINEFCTVTYHVDENAKEGGYVLTFGFVEEGYAIDHENFLTDLGADAKLTLKIGHNFGNYKVQKPDGTPAKEDAQHYQFCIDCGEDIYTNCDFEPKQVVPPTCTAEGYTIFVCKVCGYEVNGAFVNATGHAYSEWTPSTTEEGKHIRTCEKGCGSSETEACADYYVTSANATCTEAEIEVCRLCGGTASGDPATGHNWDGTWINVPGTKTHKQACLNANCPVGVKIADCNIELDPVSSVSATCTTGGTTVYKCTDNCGYERVENVGPLGHTWTQDAGAKTHSCRTCDADGIACSVSFVVNEATCTTNGLGKCVCGRDVVIEVNGEHPYEDMITIYKAPTATAAGYFRDHCNACGKDVKYEGEAGKLEDYIEVAAGDPFTDIKSGSTWFYDPAVFCYSYNGIMIGEYGKFNGNGQITRGQVVTVLGRIIFSSYSDKGADAFINGLSDAEFEDLLDSFDAQYGLNVGELKDLKGSYYDRYAEVLAHMGIVKGYEDNTFRGDQKVTRQEMAVFMMRFLNSDEVILEREISDASATFTDIAQVASWAVADVTESGKCGLFVGADGRFRPNDNATRGELATLLERIIRATEVYPIVDYADFIKK